MDRVLVTCFEPYDEFPVNASEAAVRMAEQMWNAGASGRRNTEVVWEMLPVDFDAAPRRLERLRSRHEFTYILHTGQAPGAAAVRLEARGVNRRRGPCDEATQPLVDGGAAAEYSSDLPLSAWAAELNSRGLPVSVSQDAGAYLCNAVLYHSLRRAADRREPRNVTFLHLPLTPEQVLGDDTPGRPPSLDSSESARVVCGCLELLAG